MPIKSCLLKALLAGLDFYKTDNFLKCLLKSIFLIMYYACMRVGEISLSNNPKHVLKISNVFVQKDSHFPKIMLKLESFKHSVKPVKLCLPFGLDDNLCPTKALLKYLSIRPRVEGQFFVNSKGLPIKRFFVEKHLKGLLKSIGHDVKKFNTHSFRVGRASDLASEGASDPIIREVGRWSSSAFKKYIRFDCFQLP